MLSRYILHWVLGWWAPYSSRFADAKGKRRHHDAEQARAWSQREAAVSLRMYSAVTGGWHPSLTLPLSGKAMAQLLAQSVSWTVFALVAYGLSKLLRCRLNSDPGAPKIRSAWLPLAPVAVTLLGLIALALWAPRPEGMPFGLRLTFWRSVGFLVNVLPAGWAMHRAGEPISSAGLGGTAPDVKMNRFGIAVLTMPATSLIFPER